MVLCFVTRLVNGPDFFHRKRRVCHGVYVGNQGWIPIGQLGIRWTGKLANQEEDQAEAELWRDPNGFGQFEAEANSLRVSDSSVLLHRVRKRPKARVVASGRRSLKEI